MITNFEIMKYLEKLRTDRKITIQDFTKDICSRRNYSRYLAGEASISLEILSKLLNKIDIPLVDFSFYIQNNLMYEYIHEVYFYDLVRLEKYQKAYKERYPHIKDKEWKTIYAEKCVPMGIKLMEYQLGMITKSEAAKAMASIIKIDNIISKYLVQDDDIGALNLYVRVCDDYDKEKMVDYLIDVIETKNRKIVSGSYEPMMMNIYLTALEAMTTHSNANKYEYQLIKRIANKAIEFHSRCKLATYDVILFKILYNYTKANNIENKYIVFHYIASIISSYDDSYVEGVTFDIYEEDINIYRELLLDEEFVKTYMYERLIDYDNL